MHIRPFKPTTTEYQTLLELATQLRPDEELTVDLLKKEDEELATEKEFTRVIGEVNNKFVAHGTYAYPIHGVNNPPQFVFSVHPDFQKSDVPRLMQDHLYSKLARTAPSVISSEAKEDELYRVRLLEDDQFELKMRFPCSSQDVTQVDLSKLDHLISKLEEQHIECISLVDVMERDQEWRKNVWRMFTIIDQNVPYPNPQESVSFDDYAQYYEGEDFRPESWAIAIDKTLDGKEQYVGMSVVNIMPTKPRSLYAGITGTIPSHRRKGIAKTLKLCNTSYGKKSGYHYIETDNEENNPMYALNLQLGFEPLPAWVYYEKQISY